MTFCSGKKNNSLPRTGLLWKISGKGLKTSSILMGTYHLPGGMQILDSINSFDSIFNSSNRLVCEVDVVKAFKRLNKTENTKPNNQLKPWPVADSTYENLLSDSEAILIDSVIGSLKFSEKIKELNMRPVQLMSFFEYSFNKDSNAESSTKNNANKGILDWHLQSLAKKNKIEIIELDTGKWFEVIQDSTSGLIPQLSYRKEIDMLIFYIENYKQISLLKEYYSKKMLDAYLIQDISFSPIFSQQQKNKSTRLTIQFNFI